MRHSKRSQEACVTQSDPVRPTPCKRPCAPHATPSDSVHCMPSEQPCVLHAIRAILCTPRHSEPFFASRASRAQPAEEPAPHTLFRMHLQGSKPRTHFLSERTLGTVWGWSSSVQPAAIWFAHHALFPPLNGTRELPQEGAEAPKGLSPAMSVPHPCAATACGTSAACEARSRVDAEPGRRAACAVARLDAEGARAVVGP
eukprot:353077-Chlamydomonas_euryale.AAC.20